MQSVTATDRALVEAVVTSYAPSVCVVGLTSAAVGNVYAPIAGGPTVVTLEFGGTGTGLTPEHYYVSEEERMNAAGKKAHESVAWPEFAVVYGAAKTSAVSVRVDGVATADTEVMLDVTPYETAISLRYKHVRAMQDHNLLGAALQAAQAKGAVSVTGDAYRAFVGHYVVSAQDTNVHTVTEGGLSEAEAARYIRAMTFPPYDCATLVSKMDGQEYFVETVDQYIEYLDNIGERETDAAARAADASQINASRMPGIADCGVNVNQQLASAQPTPSSGGQGVSSASTAGTASTAASSGYANDTHFYSNVGGTIVLLKPEKDKMKLKASKHVVAIPGAAVGGNAKKKLRMNEPLIGLTAAHYVGNALNSGWIGVEGPHIKKFENALARICGVEAACAVQSGTA